jgi:hypothetical protein
MKRVLVTAFLFGCASGPKYKIDESVIAALPPEEKQAMMQAQTEEGQAKQEQQQAQAELRSLDTALETARNDYKMSKLQMDNAKVAQQQADQSGDINKKNNAARDVHLNDMLVKSADARVDWLEKKRKWLRYAVDAADAHVIASQARYELEKAKLADKKGMKPSEDFNLMNFETETLEKQKKWSEARLDAEKRRADADSLERQYNILNDQYTQAKAAMAR